MAGGIVPASVTDPALRALLEQLISATGINGKDPRPPSLGKQWRLHEDHYPSSTGAIRALLQWRQGTRWETRAALDANGALILQPGSGSLTVDPLNIAGGFTNTLTRSNLIKHWALLQLVAGPSVTTLSGFNHASATWDGGGTVTVNLTNAMANTNYGIIVSFQNASNGASWVSFTCKTIATSQYSFSSNVALGANTIVSCFAIGP